jgi:hypothetical protein
MSTPQQSSSGSQSSSVTTWVMAGLMSLGLSLLVATPVLAFDVELVQCPK